MELLVSCCRGCSLSCASVMGSVAPCLIVFTLDTPRGGTSTSPSSMYPLSVCIMSALGTFHPPRVSSARSPHTEDWSEARVCSGLVTYSDIQPVSAVSGSHSRVVTRLMRVVSMYVLNCSASTTIFTVNGSHRNTSYSDAGLKGIFSTHATINKHVDVATCCCCRLLKCNYNFCAQPPLGEVQCMCTTMQCIGKFLQLTEG